MTNLRNQLRAVAFLASRDSYVKGAFALPALWVAWVVLTSLLAPPDANMHLSLSFESSFLSLVNTAAVFGTCLAAAGVAVHDVSSGGLRAAALSARGRADYVTTRMILALVLSVALTAWTALLGLLLLLVPHVTEGMALGEMALRLLAGALVAWTYAVFGLLLLWLSRRSRGFGMTLLISIMLAAGLLNWVLLLPALLPAPFWPEAAYGLLQLVTPLQPGALLSVSASLDPLPAVTCFVCVAACWAASRALMARVSL